MSLTKLVRCLAPMAALISGPAMAQGYGYYGPAYPADYAPYYGPAAPAAYPPVGMVDGVTVYAPREYLGRSPTTGAPIERVYVSRVVPVRDLDPRTEWGAAELFRRVQDAARSACREIEAKYPFAAADNPPCYRDAVDRAMLQVGAVLNGPQPYAYYPR